MKSFAVEIIQAYTNVGKRVFENPWVKEYLKAQKLSQRCRLCQFQLEGWPNCDEETRRRCEETEKLK